MCMKWGHLPVCCCVYERRVPQISAKGFFEDCNMIPVVFNRIAKTGTFKEAVHRGAVGSPENHFSVLQNGNVLRKILNTCTPHHNACIAPPVVCVCRNARRSTVTGNTGLHTR